MSSKPIRHVRSAAGAEHDVPAGSDARDMPRPLSGRSLIDHIVETFEEEAAREGWFAPEPSRRGGGT
jgi:hypothetical protein